MRAPLLLASLLSACVSAPPTVQTWESAGLTLTVPAGWSWELVERDDDAGVPAHVALTRGATALTLNEWWPPGHAAEDRLWSAEGVRCQPREVVLSHVTGRATAACRWTDDDGQRREAVAFGALHASLTGADDDALDDARALLNSLKIDAASHRPIRHRPPAPKYGGELTRRWQEADLSGATPATSDEGLAPPPAAFLALREAHPRDRVWAWLRPAATKDRPAVIWIGADAATDPSEALAADGPLAELLAADVNLLVLRRTTEGLWVDDELLDGVLALEHARDALAERAAVRGDRVYAFGSGVGGHAALLQATLKPGLRAVLAADPISYDGHKDRDCSFGVASFLEQLTTPAVLADDHTATDTVARARFVGAPVRLLQTAAFGGRVAPRPYWAAALVAADAGPTFAPSDATLDAVRTRAYADALDDAVPPLRAAIDAYAHAPFGDVTSVARSELYGAEDVYVPPRALAERLVEELAPPLLEAKRAEERGWPELTDSDRLDSALRRFAGDERQAEQQCYDDYDDWQCSWRVGVDAAPTGAYTLATNIQRARTTGELPVALWADDERIKDAARRDLLAELHRAGLRATWDGAPDHDVIVHLTWQRRLPR